MWNENRYVAPILTRIGDGYPQKPIWLQKDNVSTYYDYEIDSQYRIPLDKCSETDNRYFDE